MPCEEHVCPSHTVAQDNLFLVVLAPWRAPRKGMSLYHSFPHTHARSLVVMSGSTAGSPGLSVGGLVFMNLRPFLLPSLPLLPLPSGVTASLVSALVKH